MYKKLFYMLLPLFILFSSFQKNDLNASIIRGLKNNEVRSISTYFSSSVNLVIRREERIYSKSQAEIILADFLKRNKAVEVKDMSRHDSQYADKYQAYDYRTDQRAFRITVKFIEVKGKPVISEFRVE